MLVPVIQVPGHRRWYGGNSIAGAGTLQYTGTGHSTKPCHYFNRKWRKHRCFGSGLMTLSGGITGNTFGLILTGTGQGLESGVIGTTSGTLR